MSKITRVLDKNILSKLHLFRNIDLDAVLPHLSNCQEIFLGKGDLILSPKVANNNLFILIRGQMFVHLNSINSEPLDTVEAGECVGEMSVFDKTFPSAYVIAATESMVLKLDSQTLWKLIDISSGIARNLIYILSQRIRYGHETISHSRKKEREHEIHANLDPLTGLHNRRWLNDVFSREIHRCEMGKSAVCLVMVDIDHFKHFNDDHGHILGDNVLRIVSETMLRHIRPNDMIARFGGEEFLILLPNTKIDDAISLSERVRIALKNIAIENKETNEKLFVTISLGIAQRKSGELLESLIERADSALYKAKKGGRDQVVGA